MIWLSYKSRLIAEQRERIRFLERQVDKLTTQLAEVSSPGAGARAEGAKAMEEQREWLNEARRNPEAKTEDEERREAMLTARAPTTLPGFENPHLRER